MREALCTFVGQIRQRPPAFSALKVGGKSAYNMARSGQTVLLEPRTITIYSLELKDFSWPFLELSVTCGRGTYIRALARDIGFTLGTGGYCKTLRRLAIGKYRVESGISPENLTESHIAERLMPLSTFGEG